MANSSGDRLLHLGLIDDLTPTHQLNGGGAARADFISARMSPTAATTAGATTSPFAFQVQSGQSSGTTATATTNNTQLAAINLDIGDWYLFTIDVTRTGTANTFSVGGSLQDFGADGLTPGTVVTFAPQTIAANTSEIYNDSAVYAAFRSHASTGGADLLDTFTVTQAVPEPASLGMMVLAGAAMLRRKRK
jgi:hypothetical protein